ncbi:protein MAATS1 isoform X2 [Gigaspora margarita]|uniref:Protein MAATS1 isoform X2 n=1 Tax=Gigaspora margarita TaxID=4874 RepID=A0A8H4AXE1_GIGMA|nr:protein MAATS1 isoform X2 [Gigaspora margarita]
MPSVNNSSVTASNYDIPSKNNSSATASDYVNFPFKPISKIEPTPSRQITRENKNRHTPSRNIPNIPSVNDLPTQSINFRSDWPTANVNDCSTSSVSDCPIPSVNDWPTANVNDCSTSSVSDCPIPSVNDWPTSSRKSSAKIVPITKSSVSDWPTPSLKDWSTSSVDGSRISDWPFMPSNDTNDIADEQLQEEDGQGWWKFGR